MSEKLPETIHFSKEEEVILDLWNKLDVFNNCLKQSKGKPRYSFYDGPPFATGLPHYGHLLTGTIKDIMTRYAHQTGYHVERRFGWDTHGLPVEFEIDNLLQIKSPDDVMKMGIANYNAECRKIVMRYATEWENIVGRLGRWIDFKNDYKTLYPWYMESIWWVFKELYNKGLVYQGVKVMPYSTACNTPLSNFESGQNYKDVTDPSVVVSFELIDEPGVHMLAWTTTPWTLPSNLALCCNPTFDYVEVIDKATKKVYIILESSLELIYKSKDLYTIQGRRKGSQLLGKKYEPLFPYFLNMKDRAFKILNDTYVTAESGTGVVHQAPYFGEDDYRCCLQAGIITKDQEPICPVDSKGRFVDPVKDFLGKYVKEADKEIIKHLKENKRLIFQGTCKHSYPFCWRSDTPLIYKAVPSWFVKVESIKHKLLETNSQTYWVPDYVKEKRFGNWLRDARDWAISRNRYWGNPIPLWISEDKKEIVCIGSIAELEKLTGAKVDDIHRESIDHLTIPSKRPGQPPLKRIPEVFDCWFESGSMPYAQMHYPFEKCDVFEDSFPADFIAEGIDQTRGWFYTLLVISTALFNKPPFKNLIANGLILASDGQKMSKRKKNYPDPIHVVNKYCADALRLYLINSPVVRAENLRFKEEGVRDVIKDVFLPWYNAFRFLMQNIDRFERDEKCTFKYKENDQISNNIMDKWILSFTETLLQFLKTEMQAYRLYTVVPRLVKYIDNLTNWYVRMNRRRIKGETGRADCELALNTLFRVVYTMARINAPFTPFLTEFMFQRLRKLLTWSQTNTDSIHYQMIPEANIQLIDTKIEQAVSCMQTIIELGRVIRDRKTLPVKYPLPEVVVIHQDMSTLNDIVSLKSYILEELNVKQLTVTTDKQKYGVTLRAEPEHRTLGARLKGDFKPVHKAIKELTDQELQTFLVDKKITVLGNTLNEEDLRLMFSFTGPAAEELSKKYEAHSENNVLILLDITPDETMQNEGLAREIINRIQKLRKKAKLVTSDEAVVFYDIKDSSSLIAKIIDSHKEFIETTTKTPQEHISKMPKNAKELLNEMLNIKGVDMDLVLVSKCGLDECIVNDSGCTPFNKFVNVELIGYEPRYGASSNIGTVLLENPVGTKLVSFDCLKQEVEKIFGIYGCQFDLYDKNELLNNKTMILLLNGKTLYAVKRGNEIISAFADRQFKNPVCKFINLHNKDNKGTILLENPYGNFPLNQETLQKELCNIFGNTKVLLPPVSLLQLNGFTLQTH